MGITSHTKHRLIKVSILCMVFMFLLSSCPPLVPRSTPYDYPGSVWESEDPHIYLKVVDHDPYNAEAYFTVGEKEYPIVYMTDNKSDNGEITFKNSINGRIQFYCNLKDNSISIKIIRDSAFDGVYVDREFVMYRIDNIEE